MRKSAEAASRRLLPVAAVLLLLLPAARAQDRLHRRVLEAFRPVVSEPSKSTTRIYCDGSQKAMGAVVQADGYIVTKASELSGNIEVQTHDIPRKLSARIVGTDPTTDLALLKVEAKDLPVLAWAGDPVPPIGSWLATPGLESSPVAIGILSVAPRKIPNGGALGITMDRSQDVPRIVEIKPDSGAAKAGLQVGDIIRQVNKDVVKGQQNLRETIGKYQRGDKVTLVVERDGKELTVEATLGSMSQLIMGERAGFQNGLGGKLSDRREGFPLALQHDTVLRPSDCGGPIVDLDGKAVGLNIARAGRVESYALPAALARESIGKLLAQANTMPADSKLVDKQTPAEGEKKIQ